MKNCTPAEPQATELLASGYVLLRGLLSDSEVTHYLTQVHRVFSIHGSPTHPLFLFSNAVQRELVFAPLLSRPETLRIVYQILGPFMQLISSELWIRPVGVDGEGWHHDGSPALPPGVDILQIKVQFFLSPVRDGTSGTLLLSSNWPAGADERKNGDSIPILANPGDAIVWAGNLRHAVAANFGTTDRVSVILGYARLPLRPYDYDEADESFMQSATAVQKLLVSANLRRFYRGCYYKPGDESFRRQILEEATATR
jgi:hypothetical protein